MCQDCFIKLTELYNFVALFHESNYRFETLLFQSSQSTTSTLPTQDCVERNINLDLPIVGDHNNLVPSKSEDLPDYSSLGLMIEYKDDMLPLENLLLNEIVEQATANNQVDIMQNFVANNDNQIYAGTTDNTQSLTILRNSKDQNNLGKLRSLHNYLETHDGETNLVTNDFIKCNENQNLIKNDTNNGINSYNTQAIYPQSNVINNNSIDSKQKVIKKRNSKLVVSVETIRKAVENERQQKAEANKIKKIVSNNNNNNSLFERENILNEIANQTNEVDIDNIDVQNLVSTSDEQICTDLIMRNTNLDRIDNIEKVYLDLEQRIQENTALTCSENLNKSCDPLQLDCSYQQNLSNKELTDDDIKNKMNMKKRNNKVNIIAVTTICKMMEKRPQLEIIPKRSRLNRCKDSSGKSEAVSLKSKVNKAKSPDDKQSNKAKRFTCIYCKKTFGRRQHMNEHMKKHESSRPYICEICNKTFAIQWDLTFHKRVHTDLYSCQHCGKCFSAPSKLQRHIRIHTGERPFICSVKDCGRSFSDKRNLIGHQITHTNIRKFTCDVCKRSYKTKSQLKDHMQAHSKNPAFKCTDCGKSYKWKTNLLIHMKKHNGYEIKAEKIETHT